MGMNPRPLTWQPGSLIYRITDQSYFLYLLCKYNSSDHNLMNGLMKVKLMRALSQVRVK